MNRMTNWMLVGVIAVGSGCAATARADEPVAPEPARAAIRQQMEAEIAQARAAADEARGETQETRKRTAEVRARLKGELEWASNVKKEKAAFLGVSTSPVPGALRQQMKLARGFGLVVDTVEKDSAAATAGIEQYDILQKLNDQLLVNSQQLGVLVRAMKDAEQVSVTFLRQGQPMTVTATLKVKEVPVLGDGSWNLEMPTAIYAAGGNAMAPLAGIGAINVTPEGTRDFVRMFAGNHGGESSSMYNDSEMSLTVTENDGDKTLLAKDNAGETLFEGPITTDDQRSKLPEKVAEKLKKFESKIENVKIDGKNVRLRVLDND